MGKSFGKVVLEEAIEPTKTERKEIQVPAMEAGEEQPQPQPQPRKERVSKPKPVVPVVSNKRFRIELTEQNAKKRTFPIRNDIGLSLDRYCLDHNVDRQTLVNLMIKTFLEQNPEGVKFEQF